MIPPALVNSIWCAKSLRGAARFERALRRPREAQERVLRRILQRNEASSFGIEHNFTRINSVKELRSKVPIRSYDGFEPYIDRLRQGEQAVLTVETPRALLPTSGSTSPFKLIPFTKSFQLEMDRAIAPWICGMFAGRPGIAAGRAYWSVSPAINLEIESAIPVGFDSDTSYLAGSLARLLECTLAVPSSVTQIDDIETFRYVTLLHLLRAKDLSLVSVWHPTYLTLLLDALPVWFDRLVEDIGSGTCKPPNGESMSGLPKRKRRASELKTARMDPSRIWPALRLVSTWTHAEAKRYAKVLGEQLQSIPIESKGLVATEGIVTIPYRAQHPLAICSHYLEFLDDYEEIVELEHLQIGETYSVVMTTGSGLFRYRIGDLVRVTSRLGSTPCLEFVGREGGFSDLCGEKLHPSFVNAVVDELLDEFKITALFTLLAPRSTTPDAYCLYIETNSKVSMEMKRHLDTLLSRNPHYRLCRRLGQLGEPTICHTASNSLQRYIDAARRNCQRVGDQKPSVLSSESKWDQVLGP